MWSGCVLLLLVVSNVVSSQSIVKTLPGFEGDLPFTLETGYVGVGYKEEVQLFYYFIESEKSPGDDPLLLWLAGGPACSGVSSVFYQLGPLSFNIANSSWTKPTFLLNPFSWTKAASVIYLDSPVGTGFSYSTSSEGYKVSDLSTVSQAYEFIRKWLVAHPKFLTVPFYIAGDSYSGIAVSVLVQEIYTGLKKGDEPQLNLKGFLLGNPFTDWKYDWNMRIPYFHRNALLSDELYESIKQNCKGEYWRPDRSNEECITNLKAVNETWEAMFVYNVFEPKCERDLRYFLEDNYSFQSSSIPQQSFGELSRDCADYFQFSEVWCNDKTVQSALHVREGTVDIWTRCNLTLRLHFSNDVHSSLAYHRNFTRSNLRALIFSGDYDLAVTHIGTQAWIESLNMTLTTGRRPWSVGDRVAGEVITYSKKKYHLTFATIKGAGHTGAEYKPEECFAIIQRWLGHQPL